VCVREQSQFERGAVSGFRATVVSGAFARADWS